MLIGYVSGEMDSAPADVSVELVGDSGSESVATRSRASGAVYADVPHGWYRVYLSLAGYGAKHVGVAVGDGPPVRFRLLSDGLLGYVWRKWVRAGQAAEFRVHSPEPYRLDLYRFGRERDLIRPLGWFDDHGPRATIQLIPDGDFTQTGINWNRVGYGSAWHQQRVEAPARSGLHYFEASTLSGRWFSFPWIVAPALPRARIAVLAHNLTWKAYNAFGGRSNYVNQSGMGDRPVVHAKDGPPPLHPPGRLAPLQTFRRRYPSIDPNRTTWYRAAHDPPIRSKAGWSRPWLPVNGVCWPGWNARASTTTCMRTRSRTWVSWTSTPTRS